MDAWNRRAARQNAEAEQLELAAPSGGQGHGRRPAQQQHSAPQGATKLRNSHFWKRRGRAPA